MIVAVGCDHAGFALKSAVTSFFEGKAEILDCGIFMEEQADYPDIALKAAQSVAESEADLGVLLCGTGMGMAIAANKIKGIRAGVCHDVESARLGRAHNCLNVLCMGGRRISPDSVPAILSAWITTPFEGGRHWTRINKIAEAEGSELLMDAGDCLLGAKK